MNQLFADWTLLAFTMIVIGIILIAGALLTLKYLIKIGQQGYAYKKQGEREKLKGLQKRLIIVSAIIFGCIVFSYIWQVIGGSR